MPSLSQKYRPRRFHDVTGQEHITETLRREVASGQLGHAYLFSGPRGVGKTTAARIFAKALNCLQSEDGEPCNACANCVAANEGRLLDLIELDAATHTGIDTVREAIIEHVRFAPTQGKRKVYVLDEAHMLSTSSFNALLKTLEEPPAYAFFILATTEWHKVPATIISRCQRFDFKRIADDKLTARVQELAEKEGWTLDPEVARLIVSRSDGCVRDAETLLGQLGSLAGEQITMEVAKLVIPERHLAHAAGLLQTWGSHDHAASLAEAARLVDVGVPMVPLFDDVLFLLQRVLAASGSATTTLAENASEESRLVAGLHGIFTPGEITDMALMLMERRKDLKSGVDPLFALQLAGTAVACRLLRHSGAPPVNPPPGGGARGGGPQPVHVPTPIPDPVPAPSVVIPSPSPVIVAEAPAPHLASPQGEGSDDAGLTLPMIRSKWAAIIRAVDEKNHSLPFILKISQPEQVQGKMVTIRFQYAFHRDKVLVDIKNKRIVEDAVNATLGMEGLQLDGIVGEEIAQGTAPTGDMASSVLKTFGGAVVETSE